MARVQMEPETLPGDVATFVKKVVGGKKATTDFATAEAVIARLPGWKVERDVRAMPLTEDEDLRRWLRWYERTAGGPSQLLSDAFKDHAGKFGLGPFWTWAKNTTFVEDVKKLGDVFVKTPSEEDEARERIGSLEHTGRCPICARIQKFHGIGKKQLGMFDHGYQIPAAALRMGFAPRMGSCFGVGYPPYEVSVRGVIVYIDHLSDVLATQEKALAALLGGKTTVLRFPAPVLEEFEPPRRASWDEERAAREAWGKSIVTYVAGGPRWEDAKAHARRELEAGIQSLKTEIAFFRKRRAEWKRVDTYDEQQAGERLYA